MHRVAITGIGLVTALGPDAAATWAGLVGGANGIGPITWFDASAWTCRLAAEVRDVPADPIGLASVPDASCRRSVRLFLQSVREAWRDAGLADGSEGARFGVAAGASVSYVHNGLVRAHFRFRRPEGGFDVRRFADAGCEPAGSFGRRLGDLAAAVPARALRLRGPAVVHDTACAASAHAIGDAYRRIRRGEVAGMVAGGASALVSPVGILAFSLLGALSTSADPARASRPFDRRRDGFVMGEGAGAVVLERLDAARARGARIYGELCGFAASSTGYHMTQPSPDGAAEARAMRLALDEAGLAPEAIGYVAAHGTSTPRNDAVETAALKQVFGAHARRLLVSSNKGQIGHTIAAAGAANLVVALKALDEGLAPPTANYRDPDPECDLDYVPNTPRRAALGAALVNAFAFGGQNAALVVRRADG